MVAKLTAILSLMIMSFALSMGNYWFTFGLWPKSWVYFIGFAVANMCITSDDSGDEKQ